MKYKWTAKEAKRWPNPWTYWRSLHPEWTTGALVRELASRPDTLRKRSYLPFAENDFMWEVELFTKGEVPMQDWFRFQPLFWKRRERRRLAAARHLANEYRRFETHLAGGRRRMRRLNRKLKVQQALKKLVG